MSVDPDLIEALVYALKHEIPRGTLRAIIAPDRRQFEFGMVENLDARVAATALVESLERSGWQITRRPGAGQARPHSIPPGGGR